jgi:hypothetical protein
MDVSLFAGLGDRLYTAVFNALPPGCRPERCNHSNHAACGRVHACEIALAPNGKCDGLHIVLGDIVRSRRDNREENRQCITTWEMEVEVYLFKPCKDLADLSCKEESDAATKLEQCRWELLCAVGKIKMTDLFPTESTKLQGVCFGLTMGDRAECVREGLCQGTRVTLTIPLGW